MTNINAAVICDFTERFRKLNCIYQKVGDLDTWSIEALDLLDSCSHIDSNCSDSIEYDNYIQQRDKLLTNIEKNIFSSGLFFY